MLEDIKKHLRKKNKNMSDDAIHKQAELIWQTYCDINHDRDKIREEKFKKEWDSALQKENDQIAFEYLTSDELKNYFRNDEQEGSSTSEIVLKTNLIKESGYIYFLECSECSQKKWVSKKCISPENHFFDIWRKKMVQGSKGKEFVMKGNIQKKSGYMYYIDQNSNIARVKIEK